MILFSSALSHAASAGVSGTIFKSRKPSTQAGRPSSRKSHCQPRRPAKLFMLRMRLENRADDDESKRARRHEAGDCASAPFFGQKAREVKHDAREESRF